MTLLVNMPSKDENIGIECNPNPNGNGYLLITSTGWRMYEINAATPEGVAYQIQQLVVQARNQGFEQGRAFVRRALGLTK